MNKYALNKFVFFCIIQVILSSGIFYVTGAITSNTKEKDVVSLKGKVLNVAGNPISDVKITLESEGYLYKTTSDQNGYYSFIVSEGIYKFYTDSLVKTLKYGEDLYMPPNCKSYFRPLSRANIKLSYERSVVFDLVLIESGALCSWMDESSNAQVGFFEQYSHITPHPKIKYETLSLPNEIESSLDLVIQYGYRKEEKDKIYYYTPINAGFLSVFGKEFPFTIITYDSLVVYADKVFLDKKKNTIWALNAFIIENGGERSKWKEIIIDIKNTVPKISFKK